MNCPRTDKPCDRGQECLENCLGIMKAQRGADGYPVRPPPCIGCKEVKRWRRLLGA